MRHFHPLFRASTTLDPYQILSLPRSASTKDIKVAFHELAKVHHPDLSGGNKASAAAKGKKCGSGLLGGRGASSSSNLDFKDIVAAYDLLKDRKRREAYLRYGLGWSSAGGSGSSSSSGGSTAGMRPDVGFNYENVHNPWGRPKGRASTHAHERPRYPSSSWDYGHSSSTDFYSNSNQSNANAEGQYTSNTYFVSLLSGLCVLLYSVQFWRLAPPVPGASSSSSSNSGDSGSEGANAFAINHLISGDPKDAPIWKQAGMIMKGREKHHEEASKALEAAREGAQKWGSVRRDGIRRRVRESTLDAIESGKMDTGHGLVSPTAAAEQARAFEDPSSLPFYVRTPHDPQKESIHSNLLARRQRLAHQHPATIQRASSSSSSLSSSSRPRPLSASASSLTPSPSDTATSSISVPGPEDGRISQARGQPSLPPPTSPASLPSPPEDPQDE